MPGMIFVELYDRQALANYRYCWSIVKIPSGRMIHLGSIYAPATIGNVLTMLRTIRRT